MNEMKYKIKQIALLPEGEHAWPSLYALDENGDIWFRNLSCNEGWVKQDMTIMPTPPSEGATNQKGGE